MKMLRKRLLLRMMTLVHLMMSDESRRRLKAG
jgi:hypothetical protein